MTNLLLGILIGAGIVVFCLWCMERSEGVSDVEIETWLDWREEWALRKAVEKELQDMGFEEMPMAGEEDR